MLYLSKYNQSVRIQGGGVKEIYSFGKHLC